MLQRGLRYGVYMRIESARDLKREVLTEVMVPESTTQGGLVIGIAPGSSTADYKIAIRVVNASDIDSRVVTEIVKRAAHEADVRIAAHMTLPDRVPGSPTEQLLTIGAAVAHYRSIGGTLGFFARRVQDGAIGFVSCNHVIADHDKGVDGDEIVHPSSPSADTMPYVVGYLDGGYARLKQRDVYVDCAFANLASSVRYEPRLLGAKDVLSRGIASPWEAPLVEKIGRITGRTLGRITAFDLDGVDVPYDFGSVRLKAQIEIESSDEDRPFSRPGDSGSLVFTEDHRPLGLICASSRAGGTSNTGYTYANPIESVLSALGVEVVL